MKAMRVTARAAALLLVAAAVAGCATTAGSDEENGTSRNTITLEELDAQSDQTAYQVVRKLKPRWLQRRGQVSFRGQTSLLVVVDEGQYHDLSVLHSLRSGNLEEIRYLDPRQATLRFGDRANGGAILVTTR